jgi:hypothetical protein
VIPQRSSARAVRHSFIRRQGWVTRRASKGAVRLSRSAGVWPRAGQRRAAAGRRRLDRSGLSCPRQHTPRHAGWLRGRSIKGTPRSSRVVSSTPSSARWLAPSCDASACAITRVGCARVRSYGRVVARAAGPPVIMVARVRALAGGDAGWRRARTAGSPYPPYRVPMSETALSVERN